MGHLSLIDQPNSEVEIYLQKVLKTGGDKNSLANNARNDAINGNEENVANNMAKEVRVYFRCSLKNTLEFKFRCITKHVQQMYVS